MIDQALQDFATKLGLTQLPLDADGHVAWEGGGLTLHLEQVERGLLVYTAQTPLRRDREAWLGVLDACHYRHGAPVTVRPALTQDNELLLVCLLEESAAAPDIPVACAYLVALARRFTEPS